MSPAKSSELLAQVREFLLQPGYPCVAAQHSVRKDECVVDSYQRFGTGECWRALRLCLLDFIGRQKSSGSSYLSYWAVFDEPASMTEEEFEASLWRELSCLTSAEERHSDWASDKCVDPFSREFRFSLGGTELFVVGLHPNSSRTARRFARPALVFNAFTQFEKLQAQGQYEGMVRSIRAREKKFEGSVNPMVELHGETWETIQASGRANSVGWKCPFRFLSKAEKT